MKDGENTIFGISPKDLFMSQNESVKQKTEYSWIRQLSMYFFTTALRNSETVFRNLFTDNYSDTFELRGKSPALEYSYLDILLSIVNFYKKIPV